MIEDTLQAYARQDIPDSALQATDVLAVARRRNRRRTRVAGAAAVSLAALTVAGAVAVTRTGGTPDVTVAGPGCTVQHLPAPAGGALVTGIDPTGRLVVGIGGSRDQPEALLWVDGNMEVVPAGFAPQAVNTARLIVGFVGPVRNGEERLQRPVLFDGTLVPLPMRDEWVGGAAYAVNTGGDVLGTVIHQDGSTVAVRWRTTGTRTVVATVDGATGLGLTDDGVAVGFTLPTAQPLRWGADGVTSGLRLPRKADGASVRAAAGDWATGNADNSQVGPAAVRWNLRTGAAELVDGIEGTRISATGTVAGTNGTGEPAVWNGGRIRVLPTPPGSAPAADITGISADGHALAGNVAMAGPQPTGGIGDPLTPVPMRPVIGRGC